MTEIQYKSITLTPDRWATFHCLVKGFVVRNEVDLKAHENQSKNPWFCSPCIPYKECDARGLPTAAEAEKLSKIKSDFDALLKRESTGFFGRFFGAPTSVFVGSRTGGGIFQPIYYGTEDFFKEPLGDLIRKHGLANSTFALGNDSEWENYHFALHPGPALSHLLLCHAQLELRKQGGDRLIESRAVDHNFLFSDKGDRERFIRVIENELSPTFPAKVTRMSGPNEQRFGVTVTVEHAMELPTIECFIVLFAKQAFGLGGEYDGFGAIEIHDQKS